MAIVDWTPNGDIWCDKCYENYYTLTSMHIRVGRTTNNQENGGYADYDPNLTVGELIYQLNSEFDTMTRIEQDKIWLDGNIHELFEEIIENDEFNIYNFGDTDMSDLHNIIIEKLLDIRYPKRHELFGYPYSHWFGNVTLQVWRLNWKGLKGLGEGVRKGIFIHTFEPWTKLKDIARDIHEGRITSK
jgi:hypothetical protein